MRTQRLLLALALLALAAVPVTGHAAPNVLDAAAFDCSDPDVLAAAANQSVPEATPAAFFHSAPEIQPLSGGTGGDGDTCHRAGSGPFGYCTGTCSKVGTTCTEVITNLGFTCACKAKVITQP
jgi:hypothetical protein